MGGQDAFERILESLHDATLDDSRCRAPRPSSTRPANDLISSEGLKDDVRVHFVGAYCRGQRREDQEHDCHPTDERVPRFFQPVRQSSRSCRLRRLRIFAHRDGQGTAAHIRQFVRVRQALVRAEARNSTVTALLDNPRVGLRSAARCGAGADRRAGAGVVSTPIWLPAPDGRVRVGGRPRHDRDFGLADALLVGHRRQHVFLAPRRHPVEHTFHRNQDLEMELGMPTLVLWYTTDNKCLTWQRRSSVRTPRVSRPSPDDSDGVSRIAQQTERCRSTGGSSLKNRAAARTPRILEQGPSSQLSQVSDLPAAGSFVLLITRPARVLPRGARPRDRRRRRPPAGAWSNSHRAWPTALDPARAPGYGGRPGRCTSLRR